MPDTIQQVHADAILKNLARVWTEVAKSADPDKAATLRACAMTLIVATTEEADTQLVGETIAKLMHEHPCRAIVLQIRDGEDEAVTARAVAQCWMPFGTRQQICSEQIEIRASRRGLDEIHSTLLGLMVPDLPVVLWCWGRMDFLAMPEFRPILELPDRIIVDSDLGFGQDGRALQRIADLLKTGHNVTDLNWTRLTRWREEIARAFDTPQERTTLADLKGIEIVYGSARTVVGPLYLGGWFRQTMGGNMQVSLKRVGEDCSIRTVRLLNGGSRCEWDLGAQRTLDRSVGQMASCVKFPRLSEYDLLREELRILGRDPAFERALAASQELAVEGALV
jgi:glucose-6-phosphate dehydrogenase assembly protein OpcA